MHHILPLTFSPLSWLATVFKLLERGHEQSIKDHIYDTITLTGEEQIEESCRKIKIEADNAANADSSVGPLVCIPLYSSLPLQQQQRVFDPPPPPCTPDGPPRRKVVVSMKIAETSLTIDGIVYIANPGFSRQMYNPQIRGGMWWSDETQKTL
ncbi:hypothetical protein AX15_001426 [Amanita polypyramis BW_CC]|nr:hypothetical protein AX15_001426 [Amanita polypyramis BW_CC]